MMKLSFLEPYSQDPEIKLFLINALPVVITVTALLISSALPTLEIITMAGKVCDS
jgi:hypothetical protein